MRYQGISRARGGASGKPYPALFRLIPVHWTVGISPLGEGLTGRGNLFPLPCLQLPRYRNPRCPTPPAPAALLPRPTPGQGQCVAISGDQPCPGWSRGETVFGVEPMESRARRSALCAGFSGEVRSPFFSGLSPRGGPWRLSPRGGPAMPGIYPDGRPPFSPLSGPFPYISGEVTAPGAGCPPGLSGGNVSAACMWAGAVCGEGLLKLYMG